MCSSDFQPPMWLYGNNNNNVFIAERLQTEKVSLAFSLFLSCLFMSHMCLSSFATVVSG